ncbi:hypothetical protein I4U23_016807 [Adineta vaga]|nr:hypothetical protein I4U23_016807 [Adineta vaga]
MPLSDKQKEIIKSTAPLLRENGKEITSIFYRDMFKAHPHLLNMFNQTNLKIGTQPLALANTIYLAAENIDNLDALMPWIRIVGHKHRALMVQPHHYKTVGHFLLSAITEVLGDKATAEVLEAWSTAYGIIASVFIKVEKQLYADLGSDAQKDFIPLTIVKKEVISNGSVTALTMERCDGEKMCPFLAGQYLTLRVQKDGQLHNRHYSLTEPFNGKTYSVACKQEKDDDQPFGIVSNEIADHFREHDTILASLPAGEFVLVNGAKSHLFIAGGIGITALAAMIKDLKNQGRLDSVTLIYQVSKKGVGAFLEEMESLLDKDHYIVLDKENPVTKDLLKSKITPDTHVYMCGSPTFLDKVRTYLLECNHPESQVHLEVFQPALSILKSAAKNESKTQVL